MLKRTCLQQLTLFVAASAGLLVGCDQREPRNADVPPPQASDEVADHHDHPLTEEEIAELRQETAEYETAIEHIQQYQQTIQQKTTAGNPAEAHRALDNLDIVLRQLPEAARDSGVPRGQWQEVNETAQELQDLFNQIHAKIDAGEDPDYTSVAAEIDQRITALAAIEPESSE